jgi:hypothetical protein
MAGYMIVSDQNRNNGNYVLTQNPTTNIVSASILPQPITNETIFSFDFNNTTGTVIALQSNPTNVLQSNTTTTTTQSTKAVFGFFPEKVENSVTTTNLIMAPCPSGSSCNFIYLINNINTMGSRFVWSVADSTTLSPGLSGVQPANVLLNNSYTTSNIADCVGICDKTYLCQTAAWNSSNNNCSLYGSTLQSGNSVNAPNVTSVPISNPMPNIVFGIGKNDGLIYVRENAALNSNWSTVQQTALPSGNRWVDLVVTPDPNTSGLYNLVLLDNTQGTRKLYAGTYTKGSFQLNYALAPQLNQYTNSTSGTLTSICANPGNNQGYSMLGLYHNAFSYYVSGYNINTSKWIIITWNNVNAAGHEEPQCITVDQSGYIYISTSANVIYRNSIVNQANANNWVKLANSCCVVSITFAPDNRLFCVGMDYNIYYKPTIDINAVIQGTNPGWIGPMNTNVPITRFVIL